MESKEYYIAIIEGEDDVIAKSSLRDLAIYINDYDLENKVVSAIKAGADISTQDIDADLKNKLFEIYEELKHSDRLHTSYYL